MPSTVREVKAWLETLDDDDEIGVDDGGLALAVTGDPDTWFEIGASEWSPGAKNGQRDEAGDSDLRYCEDAVCNVERPQAEMVKLADGTWLCKPHAAAASVR